MCRRLKPLHEAGSWLTPLYPRPLIRRTAPLDAPIVRSPYVTYELYSPLGSSLRNRYTQRKSLFSAEAIRMRIGRPGRIRFCICAAALLAFLPLCLAQTSTHKKAAEPKPEPTEPDLVEYIRGALLSLSPSDGINDNLEVRYDDTAKVLTIIGPSGRCDAFLTALDPNHAVWDVFDPSDSDRQREKLLRLTMVSVIGKNARTCYDPANHVNLDLIGNRARFLFSQPKADDIPGFQDKMAKAFKKLIVLAGGEPEKDLF